MAHFHDDFTDRLGYVRWLWHLDHGEPPTNEAIASAGGRTGQWLTGLLKQRKAPTKASDHKAMAAFFAVSREWLFENEGEPPRPALWSAWRAARDAEARTPRHVSPKLVKPAVRAKSAAEKKAK